MAGRQIKVKGVGGGGELSVTLPEDAGLTVGGVKQVIAQQSGGVYDAAALTLVCRGQVLGDESAAVTSTELFGAAQGVIVAVSKKRKAEGQTPSDSGSPAAAAAPVPAAQTPGTPLAAGGAARGKRVVLLLRHGQCANEGGTDEQKHLTRAGHRQAELTADYVSGLFDAGLVPSRRMLVYSSSRRARETGEKLIPRLGKGLIHLGNDLLRECDPVRNPWRAEEAFNRIFRPPEGAEDETCVVVAHNNTNLYLLMRAASLPAEFARDAWRLFLLRHASVTIVSVTAAGNDIVSVGSAGHFPHDAVTWHNVSGPDTGEISRHKFSGRSIILIPAAQSDWAARANGEHQLTRRGRRQAQATAEYIRGMTDYCLSRKATLFSSDAPAAMQTALAVQDALGQPAIPDPSFGEVTGPADSTRAEAAFLRLFQAAEDGQRRETVAVVSHNTIIVYWILRALHHTPDEARSRWGTMHLRQGSITLISISADGQARVQCFGDAGHIGYKDLTFKDLDGADDGPDDAPSRPASAAPRPEQTLEELEQEKRKAFEKKDFAACKDIQQRIQALKAKQGS